MRAIQLFEHGGDRATVHGVGRPGIQAGKAGHRPHLTGDGLEPDRRRDRVAAAGHRAVGHRRRLVAGGGKSCFWGCLGLGDCDVACGFDAAALYAPEIEAEARERAQAEALLAGREAEFDQRLAAREVHIDPAELLGLMHNDQVPLLLLLPALAAVAEPAVVEGRLAELSLGDGNDLTIVATSITVPGANPQSAIFTVAAALADHFGELEALRAAPFEDLENRRQSLVSGVGETASLSLPLSDGPIYEIIRVIDPAILRPGRLDVKIKIERPTDEAARRIFSIYLTDTLPFDQSEVEEAGSVDEFRTSAITKVVDAMYAEASTTASWRSPTPTVTRRSSTSRTSRQER